MPETTKSGSKRARPVQEAPPEAEGSKPIVCNVAFCPICMAVTAAQGAAPDAVEHLLNAAREFFLAARAVIDVRADRLAQAGSEPVRLEKIEIA